MLCHLPCSCVAEMILIVTLLIMAFSFTLAPNKNFELLYSMYKFKFGNNHIFDSSNFYPYYFN